MTETTAIASAQASSPTGLGADHLAPHLDGAALGLAWTVPFAGLLLSIALLPMLVPRLWEHHFGKVAALWAAAFLLPCAARFGPATAAVEIWHALAVEYLPFILLVFSLFVVAGGIRIVGNLVGTPLTNTAILGVGTLAASLLGTTGAAMLLIRPLIRANQGRRRNAHVFVFYIFLVANIGGSLTPLGDPPLFLGFLKGVDFLWTMTALAGPMAFASGLLLALFYLIDRLAWRHETAARPAGRGPRRIEIEGLHNILYLAGIIAAVLASGLWRSGIRVPLGFGVERPLEGLVRDGLLLALGLLSWRTTRRSIRIENAFAWTPIQEVAILFAGIFATIIPVLAILRAGPDGSLAPLIALVGRPDGTPVDAAYFWLTGGLSSFLDNAPTYLIFFNLAGGDPTVLMGPLARTLTAISAGAVFMGANSYIGNAPNFMIKAICAERGIRMPSFFGYMLWSGCILVPLFMLVTVVFFAD
ncbi:sodium:proton antiporter [Methylobacterium nigriterrae]|uniref:sodium:proton antiporter n=1 Tax=Methylobacterium nigriterrae TaxID=3127512 RepID=UPI003013C290